MKNASYEIAKNLYLVQSWVAAGAGNSTPKKVEASAVNHILVIDCSGSMYGELPKLRKQLKEKLVSMVGVDDTVSIIWFSGRGQFGALIETAPVRTLKDLNDVNKAIDRWLQPQGLTGFKEPLIQAAALVEAFGKMNKNPFSLFFMSDGGDNQWARTEILKACESAAAGLASATFVEYGFYADRALLSAMAEKAGGVHIFADQFDKFEAVLVEKLGQKIAGNVKRIEVDVKGDTIGGFAWTAENGEFTTYDASAQKATVPDNTECIYYLSPSVVGTHTGDVKAPLSAVYAAMSLFATRMKPDVVYPLLKFTGDVRFINQFSTCFGKQKYTDFMEATKRAAFDSAVRLQDGHNPNLVPPDDAFTLFDALHMLAEEDDTRILLEHDEFEYSRVSRKRVDSSDALTEDERTKLAELSAEMAAAKTGTRMAEIQAQMNKITAGKVQPLKFVADDAPDGYEISSLTYNEERPNISVLVRRTGYVDIGERLPAESVLRKYDTKFKTHTFRNYTIVADGLVNVKKLPVRISKKLGDKLRKKGVEWTTSRKEPGVKIINLEALPILNRKMVKEVSAETTLKLAYGLTAMRAAQKVYKHYKNEMFPEAKIEGFKEKYGDEVAKWLAEQGITPGGFSPKMVQAESTDFIVGKELLFKLKGYSTLPPVQKVKDDMKAGKKLNGPAQLMAETIKECEDYIKKSPKKLHEKWITGQCDSTIATCRSMSYQLSQVVFTIIVGQTWFKEWPTISENTMTFKVGDYEVTGTAELKDVEIKI